MIYDKVLLIIFLNKGASCPGISYNIIGFFPTIMFSRLEIGRVEIICDLVFELYDLNQIPVYFYESVVVF